MFEYEGKEYELKFNLERLKLVEKACKMPTVADIVLTNGALSIESIETYFGFCLKDVETGSFVGRREGVKIADHLIETEGYLKVNNMLIERMAEDMPFLFRNA